mmetsp:Transcript_13016/g.54652  ORF Transcript_13016/g.54652 Transcript_13016/m.54652 type:complete len:276 (+) Transcript_13016:1389-2216(+)
MTSSASTSMVVPRANGDGMEVSLPPPVWPSTHASSPPPGPQSSMTNRSPVSVTTVQDTVWTPFVVVPTACTCARRPVLDCNKNPTLVCWLATPLTLVDDDICDIGGVACASSPNARLTLLSILHARTALSYVTSVASAAADICCFKPLAAWLIIPLTILPISPSPNNCLRVSSLMSAFASASRRASSALLDLLNGLILSRKLSPSPAARGEVNVARRAARRSRRGATARRQFALDDANLEDDARLAPRGAVEAWTSTPARRGAWGQTNISTPCVE